MKKEIWRPIKKYEKHYLVSSLGRIKSIKKGTEKILSHDMPHRYAAISLHKPGRGRRGEEKKVHILVLEAFVGKRPKNFQAAHLNGKKYDNRLENLKWVTAKENSRHRKLHGTEANGERQGNARLTCKEVKEIRFLSKNGLSYHNISDAYEIPWQTIADAVRRHTWNHVR